MSWMLSLKSVIFVTSVKLKFCAANTVRDPSLLCCQKHVFSLMKLWGTSLKNLNLCNLHTNVDHLTYHSAAESISHIQNQGTTIMDVASGEGGSQNRDGVQGGTFVLHLICVYFIQCDGCSISHAGHFNTVVNSQLIMIYTILEQQWEEPQKSKKKKKKGM